MCFKLSLTIKASITTAADDKFCSIFLSLGENRTFDVPGDLSAGRGFSLNIKPCL